MITYDEDKRLSNLQKHGFDFIGSESIFNSLGLTQRLTNNSCLCNDKSLFFMFNNVIPR